MFERVRAMIRAVNAVADSVSDSVTLRTERVSCLVCGGRLADRLFTERYELAGSKVSLGINRCQSCQQVYVSPRLDLASTELVYRLDECHTISHAYCWAGKTSDQRFEPLLDRLATRVPAGRLLDVGCGRGSFLAAAARRRQWDLEGVEPTVSAAELATRQSGATIHQATLEQSCLRSESFDIIAMLGVLEHLHDPVTTLRHVRRYLKADGVLAIYVPNFHYLRLKDTGLVSWLRTQRWSRLAPQEHLFHFTPKLLDQLLQRTGFRTERLDVGRPFVGGHRLKRWAKQAAFITTLGVYRATGVHLGGLEVIARAD